MAKIRRQKRFGRAACLFAAAVAVPAQAGEREDLEALRAATFGLIDTLVEQGWITKEKADELLKKAAKTPPPAGIVEEKVKDGDEEKVVRVPYVPEMVRQEIYDKVKQDVLTQAKSERWGEPGALPDWIDRLKMSGDLRARFQHDTFASDNAPYFVDWAAGQQINNSTESRDRVRLRGRLEVDAKLAPEWNGGARIATCRQNDPLCIDASAGMAGNRSEIRLDRAFLSYERATSDVKINVGRFNNPFLSTDLVWNSQLGFDGVAGTYKHQWNDNITSHSRGGQEQDRPGAVLQQRVDLRDQHHREGQPHYHRPQQERRRSS